MHSSKQRPELVYFIIIMIFGIASVFLTFPLANGDEGYHLSACYNIFSSNHPKSMENQTVRNLEYQAINLDEKMEQFDVEGFNKKVLKDVESDGISLDLQKDPNITAKVDIAHLPGAIGVLIGRVIYPSYGMMLYCSRISSLLFFAILMSLLIKKSRDGKWSLFLMFSIPCMQKLASPSYDIFSYVSLAVFFVNIIDLAKVQSIRDLKIKDYLYTLFTIVLLLFSKRNYIFALVLIVFLPMITDPIYKWIKESNIKKIFCIVLSGTVVIVSILFLNEKLNLILFAKIFIKNYLNTATMGRRAKTMFTVVPTILPELFNLLWMFTTFLIFMTEKPFKWKSTFAVGCSIVFLINWVGIYTGFYISYKSQAINFDELHGRYLHPYIICFLPLLQKFGAANNLKISKNTCEILSVVTCTIIFSAYLVVCYYRGYVLHVTPTWLS